jgi:branched-chain amino acid transport system permease protein
VIEALRDRLGERFAVPVVATVGGLLLWAVAHAVLPDGLPLGVVLLGVVLGSLTGLTAVGLVLIYRANRIINFAQAELGGLASVVALVCVIGIGLPWIVAVILGLAAAVITGGLIDVVVVRRFDNAPRLILTVATIGILQILGGAQLGLPGLFG